MSEDLEDCLDDLETMGLENGNRSRARARLHHLLYLEGLPVPETVEEIQHDERRKILAMRDRNKRLRHELG